MPVPASPQTDGYLIEVFSSIQGEGMLVGYRQIFLRLAECNLNCRYCDTPLGPQPSCRIEDAPGSGNFRSLTNPVALETLYNILFQWQQEAAGMHHSLSLTGGEPLLQVEVLKEWLPSLRELLPIFLETNGTLPRELEQVIDHLDWVSMDLKLESVSGEKTPWTTHRDFLQVARQKPCCVKAVVSEDTPVAEALCAVRLVHEVAPEVPLILQPVTRNGRCAVRGAFLLDLQKHLSRVHANLRIIPQTHRFLDVV